MVVVVLGRRRRTRRRRRRRRRTRRRRRRRTRRRSSRRWEKEEERKLPISASYQPRSHLCSGEAASWRYLGCPSCPPRDPHRESPRGPEGERDMVVSPVDSLRLCYSDQIRKMDTLLICIFAAPTHRYVLSYHPRLLRLVGQSDAQKRPDVDAHFRSARQTESTYGRRPRQTENTRARQHIRNYRKS